MPPFPEQDVPELSGEVKRDSRCRPGELRGGSDCSAPSGSRGEDSSQPFGFQSLRERGALCTSPSRVSGPFRSWCLRSLEAKLGRCFQKTAWPLLYIRVLTLHPALSPSAPREAAEWWCPGRDRSGLDTGQIATVFQRQAQHEASQRCARFSPKGLETRALGTILPENRGQGLSF